tara:strand:+ start:34828 stop:35376 length:549 start_codon:yes stop_codon:yes gene_type:complete
MKDPHMHHHLDKAVEKHIDGLRYSEDITDLTKSLVAGNIRGAITTLIDKGVLTATENIPGDPAETKPGDYVLGRGRISIDGAYIGSTPQVTLFYEGEVLKIAVTCDAITTNTLNKIVAGPRKGAFLRYTSCNPIGRKTGFIASDATMAVEPFDLKTDNWMTAKFIFSDFKFAWDHQLDEGAA